MTKQFRAKVRHESPWSDLKKFWKNPKYGWWLLRLYLKDIWISPIGKRQAFKLFWFLETKNLGSAMGFRKLLKLAEAIHATRDVDGIIIEAGAYRGGSVFFMAKYLKMIKSDKLVIGFDTFTGQPHKDEYGEFAQGDFGDVDIMDVILKGMHLKLDNVVFIKGKFGTTFEGLLWTTLSCSVIHLDCDIYDSYKFCLKTLPKRMLRKGLIVLDDYAWTGAAKAVDEFLEENSDWELGQFLGEPSWVMRLK